MNNSAKTNTVLLIILIVIALGIVFLQVSRKMLFSQRQNIPKETMNSEYVPGTHQEVDQNNNTQNWKTFESKYIPLSFKYKESWGEPQEYYSDAKDKTCDESLEWCKAQQGKQYFLTFEKEKKDNLSPTICAQSPDFSMYEYGNFCYKGDTDIEEFYRTISSISPDSVVNFTNTSVGAYNAGMFVMFNSGYGGGNVEKRVLSKIEDKNFKGIDISLPMMSFIDEPWSVSKSEGFFKKYKILGDKDLVPELKQLVEEYDFFIKSIQINDK